MTEEDEPSPGEDEAPRPFNPTDTIPERPPPSSSYAPQSLTPFRPLQAPELPEARPSRSNHKVLIGGFLLGTALVAFALGVLVVLGMAG